MADRTDLPAGSNAAGNQDTRWLPAVAARTDLERAGGNSHLFRMEVFEARQTQWLGTVMLAPRASFRLFTLFAVLAAAAIVALLWFGQFTRTARVNGWLLPQ